MSGRKNFFKRNPKAVGHAVSAEPPEALVQASLPLASKLSQQKQPEDRNEVVIVGAGVGGLTTAIEMLRANKHLPEDAKKWKVTILEAHDRTGGRCRSLRKGDKVEEAATASIDDNTVDDRFTQEATWEHVEGEAEPYLNAGPGRICSSHKKLLKYLKEFKVPLEVYVMNSAANITHTKLNKTIPNRRFIHDTRGRIAQEIAHDLHDKVQQVKSAGGKGNDEYLELKSKLDLMISFGGLVPENPDDPKTKYIYKPEANQDGEDTTSADRSGYLVLPQVRPGVVERGLTWKQLLDSKFWDYRVYQSDDFLWQPTLLQPVYGMDQVEKYFAEEVRKLGGEILLNHPVTKISYDSVKQGYEVEANGKVFFGHYCFSNAAIPFLKKILEPGTLESEFEESINAVYNTQVNPEGGDQAKTFLQATCKVGWQGDRDQWQTNRKLGGVPIFGGISYTDHTITQVWYPSSNFHDSKGILTGCYNYEHNALELGAKLPKERLEVAVEGAKQLHLENLQNGISIAWHKIPYIHGGWTAWQNVPDSVKHFNVLIKGSGASSCESEKSFFIVGDQLSSLPGWQEGAIASARNATRILLRGKVIPRLRCLPDTRISVQGI